MYNFNVITIFFTVYREYRLKRYLFITWIPSCWPIIQALVYKSGKKCGCTLIFIEPKEAGENKFTAVLLTLWLAPFWKSDSTLHAWGMRWGESLTWFFLQTRPALFQSCFWSCHLHRIPTAGWRHHEAQKCTRSWFSGPHPAPIWAKKIPHFNIFLVLCKVNQFALSHWFFYCLHDCMNEWWVGPRAGLDVLAKKKYSLAPAWIRTPDRLTSSVFTVRIAVSWPWTFAWTKRHVDDVQKRSTWQLNRSITRKSVWMTA